VDEFRHNSEDGEKPNMGEATSFPWRSQPRSKSWASGKTQWGQEVRQAAMLQRVEVTKKVLLACGVLAVLVPPQLVVLALAGAGTLYALLSMVWQWDPLHMGLDGAVKRLA
jgi:hypothetical protein